MIQKLWVYNFDQGTVDWAYAESGQLKDMYWVRRTDGDGTATIEYLGHGVFLTEKDANEGLLKALVLSKNEIESMIEVVKARINKM